MRDSTINQAEGQDAAGPGIGAGVARRTYLTQQIAVADIGLAFFATVLTGGRRFAHLERLRSDEVVQAILGVARMPSAMTLTRYFGGLVRSQIEHLSAMLGQFMLERLRAPALGAVLDLDSTVFERYGRQQGSLKGYNPRKHGRPSHQPLLAILAEAKVVLHAWLRSGNTSSARGVKAFLAETLAKLPDGFRLYALRADSGFFVTEFLVELERRALPYAIAVRMNQPLRHTVAGISQWTRPSTVVWKRPRPATKPTAGRPRAGWWWYAKRRRRA